MPRKGEDARAPDQRFGAVLFSGIGIENLWEISKGGGCLPPAAARPTPEDTCEQKKPLRKSNLTRGDQAWLCELFSGVLSGRMAGAKCLVGCILAARRPYWQPS